MGRGNFLPILAVSLIIIIFLSLVLLNLLLRNVKVQNEAPLHTKSEISFIRDGNIWISDDDGSNQKQITKSGNVDEYSWFPGLNKVIFSRIDNTRGLFSELVILEIENGQEKVLYTKRSTYTGPYDKPNFILSPNGKLAILFGVFNEEGNGFILLDIEDGTEKNIFNNDQFGKPIFSPDGQNLAVIQDFNIYLISLRDFTKKQLTHYVSPYEKNPDLYVFFEHPQKIAGWSPDSKNILFIYGNLGGGALMSESSYHLYQLGIDTLNSKKLSNSIKGELDYFLDQTANGGEVYFLQHKESPFGYKLYRKDVNENKIIEIFLPSGIFLSAYFSLDVDPSGKRVVYEYPKNIPLENKKYSPTKTDYEVWVMTTDRSNNIKVLDNAQSPSWVFKY